MRMSLRKTLKKTVRSAATIRIGLGCLKAKAVMCFMSSFRSSSSLALATQPAHEEIDHLLERGHQVVFGFPQRQIVLEPPEGGHDHAGDHLRLVLVEHLALHSIGQDFLEG